MWLLMAQVAVILPHVLRLPLWVILICIGCCAWRVMVYQGRWGYPGRWVRGLFVVAGFIGIGVEYQARVYGLESALALLILAIGFKLLEMRHRRDAFILILLSYFVTVTQLLFAQTILFTLYCLITLLLTTAALIGLNQQRFQLAPARTLRLAVILLAQSLPMMLVLFVMVPRVSPFWSVPIPSQVAKSGVSDQMRPGDVATLSLSPALAFKASFSGPVPGASQLYWRGLVLENYDGKVWTRSSQLKDRAEQSETSLAEQVERLGNTKKYSMVLEPTQQRWLFSLAAAALPSSPEVMLQADSTLIHRRSRGVTAKFRYDVTSDLDYRLETHLDDPVRQRNTSLPDGSNPRTRQLVSALRQAASDDADYVTRVLIYYADEKFTYTLQPDLLGDNDIDEFLFDSRRGFCEHFAGSFVFMMRVAGIPARVVLGYQGGEYNALANYVAVHQFDAHAWAEVWYEGRGWIRVDPTQMVSPARIQQGLESAVADENTFLASSPLSWLKYRQLLWLQNLRQQLGAVGHYWDNWVVGYNAESQIKFLAKYFKDLDAGLLGLLTLTVLSGLLGVLALFILRTENAPVLTPIDRQYLRFCALLKQQGLERQPGEGPLDYSRRISQQRPELAVAVERVTQEYVRLNYDLNRPNNSQRLKENVSCLRFKVLASALSLRSFE